jgi:squalene-hopene/tetraprenyl-beta-curcumene cyclase
MRILCAAAMAAVLLAGCTRPSATASAAWKPDAAAAYLDARADWWMTWRDAARDRGTFCISCHTTLPYALARPDSARERAIADNVRTRVRHWADVAPYYGAHAKQSAKAVESRGTEAILNALILAEADARTGRLSDDTRQAFDHMWGLQQPSGVNAGAWPWLQFGLEPWEGAHGDYYGAILAALAIGAAPGRYASTPAIQGDVDRLRSYLDREFDAQPLSNRAVLLWASTKLAGLVSDERRARLAADLRRAQERDGGWSLQSLSGRARWWDPRRVAFHSDGYATGIAVLALAGTNGGDDPHVTRGLAWLATHQNAVDGSWPGYSLNALESPSADVARFMNDAATAYAVLALAEASPQVR